MAKKKDWGIKPQRFFLEGPESSDSFIHMRVSAFDGQVDVTLHDCYKSINWSFGSASDPKQGRKKIARIKKWVDELYAHFHKDA